MCFRQTFLTRLLLVFGAGLAQGVLASEAPVSNFPTAREIFEKKSDPMPITLTYLSYLQWDKQNNFKMYKLMYGLEDWKKRELEGYLTTQVEQYKKNGWTLEFLDVGKGLFANTDSPGVVIAHKCVAASCEVEIAFRGTRSLDDWGNNLNFVKTPLRFVDESIKKSNLYKAGKVHGGFLKAYNTVSQKISDILDELRKTHSGAKFRIRIGGHSLGGSLATLCAAHIAMKFEGDLKATKNMVQLETYGSPRTLGEKLSGELTALLGEGNIMRFVNKDDKGDQDMVTKIPLGRIFLTQFRHIGTECVLTPEGSEIYEGFPKIKVLRTPHRIEGYKAAYFKQKQCGVQQQKAPPKSFLPSSFLGKKRQGEQK